MTRGTMGRVAVGIGIVLVGRAHAIELAVYPIQQWRDSVDLSLSETATLAVYLHIHADNGTIAFADIFFDATPLNDGSTDGYEVVGREFTMTRNDGSGWFRAVEWDGSPNIEDYALIAADDEEEDPIGTSGPWDGYLDSIIIHGTEVGAYRLYFENEFTAEDDPRPPILRGPDGIEFGGIWGEPIHFANAWRTEDRDDPFRIRIVPEPASLLIMAAGAGLLWRRRRA